MVKITNWWLFVRERGLGLGLVGDVGEHLMGIFPHSIVSRWFT